MKSTTPVLHGEWLRPGTHVNSVGTARRDQREIDPETFVRSARIVVDTKEGVFGEAGDAFAARDVLRTEVHELSQLVTGGVPGSRPAPDEITLFKSVGTGIQDIALRRADSSARGRALRRNRSRRISLLEKELTPWPSPAHCPPPPSII